MRTSFPGENGGLAAFPQDSPNILGRLRDESEQSEQNVKCPKRLRHRGKGKVLATIYKRPEAIAFTGARGSMAGR